MIPVPEQPEPDDFDKKVRQPGKLRLAKNPDESRSSQLPRHWTRILDELYDAYHGICAYHCIYIERSQSYATVDHFLPKSKHRQLAYEWSNYRLCCPACNAAKGDHEGILDPFDIKPHTFRIDFLTGEIYPAKDAPPNARKTIDILGLNEEDCKRIRREYFDLYCETQNLKYTSRKAPFVYEEIRRQNM